MKSNPTRAPSANWLSEKNLIVHFIMSRSVSTSAATSIAHTSDEYLSTGSSRLRSSSGQKKPVLVAKPSFDPCRCTYQPSFAVRYLFQNFFRRLELRTCDPGLRSKHNTVDCRNMLIDSSAMPLEYPTRNPLASPTQLRDSACSDFLNDLVYAWVSVIRIPLSLL